jgi:hypothetical protein
MAAASERKRIGAASEIGAASARSETSNANTRGIPHEVIKRGNIKVRLYNRFIIFAFAVLCH